MQCKKEVQSSEGGRPSEGEWPLITICVPLRKDEKAMSTLWRCWFISLTAFFGVFFLCAHDVCADDRPNILVIWGLWDFRVAMFAFYLKEFHRNEH